MIHMCMKGAMKLRSMSWVGHAPIMEERKKICVEFHTEVLKVRFRCRLMDNIKADVTETYC